MGDFNPKNGALCFLNAEQVGKILAMRLFRASPSQEQEIGCKMQSNSRYTSMPRHPLWHCPSSVTSNEGLTRRLQRTATRSDA